MKYVVISAIVGLIGWGLVKGANNWREVTHRIEASCASIGAKPISIHGGAFCMKPDYSIYGVPQ